MQKSKKFRPIQEEYYSTQRPPNILPSLGDLCIKKQLTALIEKESWGKLPLELQEKVKPNALRFLQQNTRYALEHWAELPPSLQALLNNLNRHLLFYVNDEKDISDAIKMLSTILITAKNSEQETSEEFKKAKVRKDIIGRRDVFNQTPLTCMIKMGNFSAALALIKELTPQELAEMETFTSPAKQEQRASPSFYPHYTTSNSALYQAACCGQINLKRALEAKVEYKKLMPQEVLKAIHKKFKQKFPEIDEEEYTDSDEETSAEICLNNSCLVDEAGRSKLFHADISHIPFYATNFPYLIMQEDNFGKTPFEYFLFTNQCDKAITLVNSLKENAIPLEKRTLTKMLHTTIKIGNTPLLQHLLTAFSPLPSFILLESLKQSLKYSQQFPQVIEHFLNFIKATATQDKPQPLEEFNHFAVGYIDRGGYLIHEVARYAPQLVEKFINLGLDVTLSSVNYFEYTPLMVVIKYHPKVYPAFIKPSILHKKSSNGLTALDYAQREKREEWVKALICHLSSTDPEQTV
jgi:hypothetical protein